jgi:hypothetical protein
MFSKPSNIFVNSIRDELVDYWGQKHFADLVVSFEDKNWLVKAKDQRPEQKQRDYLAYLLGKDWANIPQVRTLSDSEFMQLAELFPSAPLRNDTTWLVRLVQDYQVNELPIQDLSTAMAAELIFSIWVRRRDAHASNRALIDGIPMFFDFEVAFLGEPKSVELDTFLKSGPDSGYVGNWRVYKIPNEAELNLSELRKLEQGKPLTLIPVDDEDKFYKALARYVKHIKSIDQQCCQAAVNRAGFGGQQGSEIMKFLIQSRGVVETSVERVVQIMRQ